MAPNCDSLSLYAACTSADPEECRAGLQKLTEFLYSVARFNLNANQYDDFAVQECVQRAVIAIYLQLQNQKGPDSPKAFCAWVTRIAINKCVDQTRRDMRRPTEPLEQASETVADDKILPEHRITLDEANAELLLAIQDHPDLSDDAKTTLIQGYIFEKSDQEIADMLEKKPANIRLIRHRSLVRLRNDDDFCTRLRQ